MVFIIIYISEAHIFASTICMCIIWIYGNFYLELFSFGQFPTDIIILRNNYHIHRTESEFWNFSCARIFFYNNIINSAKKDIIIKGRRIDYTTMDITDIILGICTCI